MQDLIKQKVDELCNLAESLGDKNTQIVLYALLGAKHMGQDSLLAGEVQNIVRDKLIPQIKDGQASLN